MSGSRSVETSPELVRTLAGHSNEVTSLALSADGRLAVSASKDKTLKVWDMATGRELRTFAGHTDEVMGVALSADGRLAVSASMDETLKVWDVATGHELRTLQGYRNEIRGVSRGLALSTDGRIAVAATKDNTLKVWDVATGRELCTLKGRGLKGDNEKVMNVALSADGLLAIFCFFIPHAQSVGCNNGSHTAHTPKIYE